VTDVREVEQRMGRVRIAHGGADRWGTVEGEEVVLDDGTRVPEAEAVYRAPVEPSKIIAVHLTYRSRIEEYKARTPDYPSYFMKPPTTLNGHRGELRRPAGAQFLNYEGELAVVIGSAMHGVSVDDALSHVAGVRVIRWPGRMRSLAGSSSCRSWSLWRSTPSSR